MKLSLLEKKIASIPIIIKSNRESLFCSDISISTVDGKLFKDRIDDPKSRMSEKNIAIVSNDHFCSHMFPKVAIREKFYELDFDKHLINKLDQVNNYFLRQSQIGDLVIQSSQNNDFLILIIVDGLSYTDCISWGNVVPCYVDTLTKTKCGYTNIVGTQTTIADRLFSSGYRNFYGFSYWDHEDDNDLNSKIFKGISNLEKIFSMIQINEYIEKIKFKKTYVQIAVQGLDGIAHRNRDLPLIKPIVDTIFKYTKDLISSLNKSSLSGKLFLTSDHGILWKHQNDLKVLQDKSLTPRYCSSHYPDSLAKVVITPDNKYSAMRYPYVLRQLKSNEWGVHGGISLAESIIPLYNVNINSYN